MQDASLWRGRGETPRLQRVLPSGYAEFDAILPGGGWPVGGLIELLTGHRGIGALRLLMPVLARLSQEQRWLAWIAPPYLPYAPALASSGVDLSRLLLVHPRSHADTLWATEQALRSGTCGAVLGWLEESTPGVLRRLQLAAESGDSLGVLFRSERAVSQASPAALRLRLVPEREGWLNLEIVKCRGSWPAAPLRLPIGSPDA